MNSKWESKAREGAKARSLVFVLLDFQHVGMYTMFLYVLPTC